MVVLTQAGLRRGVDLKVNMLGRWAVWPTMSALGLAMITETWLSEALLYLGLALTLAATLRYLQDGWGQLQARRSG
jgi:phosphatidylglycerophosphate synthase